MDQMMCPKPKQCLRGKVSYDGIFDFITDVAKDFTALC